MIVNRPSLPTDAKSGSRLRLAVAVAALLGSAGLACAYEPEVRRIVDERRATGETVSFESECSIQSDDALRAINSNLPQPSYGRQIDNSAVLWAQPFAPDQQPYLQFPGHETRYCLVEIATPKIYQQARMVLCGWGDSVYAVEYDPYAHIGGHGGELLVLSEMAELCAVEVVSKSHSPAGAPPPSSEALS